MTKLKLSPYVVLPPLIFAVIATVFILGLGRENPDALPSQAEGKPAPMLTVTQFGDEPQLTAADLQAPGVKLVNFWASWCGPCRVEHPNLQELAESGVTIHGINYKDTLDKAQAFLDELGSPYAKMGMDAGRTGLDWGLYGVPETFVIDRNGTVVLRFAGPVTQRVLTDTILPAIEAAEGS
jgi:cytochrome c biogenesis protein CcmG/thiol:disulfide interchange protein DsbE